MDGKLFKILGCLCVLSIVTNSAYATLDTVRIDGIRYELRTDGEVGICSVINSEEKIVYSNAADKTIDYTKYSNYSGDIVIPQSVNYNGIDYTVTGISDYAFAHCYNLRSLSLPQTITSIGYSAFTYCTGISQIELPDAVSGIGVSALSGCHRLLDVKLPSNLDSVPAFLFSECLSIRDIKIPEGVVYVGVGAFEKCFRLESIHFPSTLNKIGSKSILSFQFELDCLSDVYINAVTPPVQERHPAVILEDLDRLFARKMPCILHVPTGSEEDYANAEGWNYFHTTVGFDVASGPDYNFKLDDEVKYNNHSYSSLKSILPDNIHEINGIAYTILSDEERTCSVIVSKILYHGNLEIPEKVSIDGTEYTVVALTHHAFTGCFCLESVKLPETIVNIESEVFKICFKLDSLRLPEKVKKITLTDCTSLRELIVESNEIDININMFGGISVSSNGPYGCQLLDDIYLLNAYEPSLVSLPVPKLLEKKPKVRLHVPEDALSAFKAVPEWNTNYEIIGIPAGQSKIKSVPMPLETVHYGIDGRVIDENTPGLHIIRMRDGKVIKRLVK